MILYQAFSYVPNSASLLASNEKPAIMIYGAAEGLSGDSDPLSILYFSLLFKDDKKTFVIIINKRLYFFISFL